MTTLESGRRVARMAELFGLLGGGVAWLIHLVAAATIAEWGSFSGFDQRTMSGVTLVAWLIIALTVAMMAVAVAATCVALRVHFRMSDTGDAERRDTSAFLARVGLVASGIFVLIILVQSLPVLFFLGDA